MKKVVCYYRVSTKHQDLGLQAQRQQCREFAKKQGWSIVDEVKEKISGGSSLDKREALLDAISLVELHKADHLLVAKHDRLARDLSVSAMVEAMLAKKKSSVVSADGSANGSSPEQKLMRQLMLAYAEFERALIKQRIKAALKVKKMKKEIIGINAPYGFSIAKNGKDLIENPTEQKTMKLAKRLHKQGLSLRKIAKALDAKGHKPRKAKQWYPSNVKSLLN